MSVENAKKILKSHQLKATQGRIAVLELFFNTHKALSHSDIESALQKESIDRVTIYRILDCYVANNIIHKVSSEQAVQLFALSKQQHEHSQHAHFICNSCDSVECFDLPIEIQPEVLQKNNSFQIHSIDITIHGTCSHCTQ